MQEAVAPDSDADSDRDPESHDQQRLPHYHPDDGSAVGAKGHANADLPGPLFDNIGEQTVETDDGDESEPAKTPTPPAASFCESQAIIYGFRHGGKFTGGEMRIDFGNLPSQLCNHALRTHLELFVVDPCRGGMGRTRGGPAVFFTSLHWHSLGN